MHEAETEAVIFVTVCDKLLGKNIKRNAGLTYNIDRVLNENSIFPGARDIVTMFCYHSFCAKSEMAHGKGD